MQHFAFGLILIIDFIAIVTCDIAHLPEFHWVENECPTEDSKVIQNRHILWNHPDRAYKTLPKGFVIQPSSIPEGGLGVFSELFIPRYTFLAEYEGEIVLKLDHISDYAWKVTRHGKEYFYSDAYDVATSNWLRWINCPRHFKEENVDVHECRGKMYYMTNKDIYPGQELLVYYGDGYAERLGIDIERYMDDSYFHEITGNTCYGDQTSEIS